MKYVASNIPINKLNSDDITLLPLDELDNIIKNFNYKEDRVAIIKKNAFELSHNISKIKHLVVVNMYSDCDIIETTKTNGANVIIFELLNSPINKIEYYLLKWLNSPPYKPDGFHDDYVKYLRGEN